MTGTVEAAIQEIKAASQGMAQSVSALSIATTSSIDKLNVGAERINTAATNFATAGDRVTGVMSQAANVSAKLSEVSGSLTTSASAVQAALADYRAQREAVAQLLTDVRATVDLARKEASLTADVLQRIESSTAKLGTAQKAADAYLDGVSEVLAESSEAFRESVVSTLSKVNYDFHEKLSSAVGLLSTAVQELEVTLGSLAPKR
jgi:ABC-type transporter Mla subunit MlaD